MSVFAISTERRAWLILLASFIACCVLTVGVPSTALYIVNSASYPPNMNVRLQAGIVTAYCDGELESDAKVVSVQGRPVQEGCTIMVGADNESIAELFVDTPSASPEAPPISLIRVQLYAGTRLRIDQARMPRFSFAAAAPALHFVMLKGRLEMQVPPLSPLQVQVSTPQLQMIVPRPGEYSVLINGVQSHAMVWAGQATVSKADSAITSQTLSAGKRLTVDASSEALIPSPAPQNLIRNSDFSVTLAPSWQVRTDTSDNGMDGVAEIVRPITEPILDLRRVGENLGWGHTGVVQTVAQAVTSTRDLRVRVGFRILEQQIDVCGSQGSECPLMIDLRYRRKDGSAGQWVQGFYARGEALGGVLPDYMTSNRQGRHIFKSAGLSQLFVSENLMQLIPELERVDTLEVYAEGHSVHTQVMQVALLAYP